MSPNPGPGSVVRQHFIDVVLDTLGVEHTAEHERICDLMLFRLVQKGVVFLPLPADVATKLASNPGADIPVPDTTSTVESDHAAADLQGDASAQGR